MTLKEKFEQYSKQKVWEKKNYNAEECEDIADEFAIGFAEWYEEEILAKGDFNMIDKSKIELLEIYKKENEL